MTRSPAVPGDTLVLDSVGLTEAVLRDRTVTTWLVVEVVHPRINARHWTGALFRLVVEPVSESSARRAAALLVEVSLHGHK